MEIKQMTSDNKTTTPTTTATDGTLVEVHYRGTLADGTEFDSSFERGEPIKFTVGEGPMIPGFVAAITGMSVGQTKTVTIASSEAYGDRNPEAVTLIPKTSFPTGIELVEGMPVPMKTPTGQTVYGRITEQQDETVTVDLNHPLAGEDLQFEIEMVSVAEATTETTTTTSTDEGIAT
jgi:peptidylprolyl isomerase